MPLPDAAILPPKTLGQTKSKHNVNDPRFESKGFVAGDGWATFDYAKNHS